MCEDSEALSLHMGVCLPLHVPRMRIPCVSPVAPPRACESLSRCRLIVRLFGYIPLRVARAAQARSASAQRVPAHFFLGFAVSVRMA